MTTYRLQHAFQGRSGDAKDMYVNTFHFVSNPVADPSGFAFLVLAVKAFYEVAAPGATDPIKRYMSHFALGAGRQIKVYDLSDPVDSAAGITRPVHYSEVQFTEITPLGSDKPLPEECAVCLSMEGLHIAGGNIKRRRGRIYLGPLSVNALQGSDVNGQALVAPELAQSAVSAAAKLMGDALALGFTWVVHSPTAGTNATLGRVWCDNAFDTQRGRGKPSTARIVQEGSPFEEGVG